MTHIDKFRFVIDWIPVCVSFHEGGAALNMALEPHGGGFRVHRVLSAVDPDAMRRVWKDRGSISGSVSLVRAEVDDNIIVHIYLHVVGCRRVDWRLQPQGILRGLEWVRVQNTSLDPCSCGVKFLQDQLGIDPLLPCRFLPERWTASEYRGVREALCGKAQDKSNGRKHVEALERRGIVRRLPGTIPTLTKPATAWEACAGWFDCSAAWHYFIDGEETP